VVDVPFADCGNGSIYTEAAGIKSAALHSTQSKDSLTSRLGLGFQSSPPSQGHLFTLGAICAVRIVSIPHVFSTNVCAGYEEKELWRPVSANILKRSDGWTY